MAAYRLLIKPSAAKEIERIGTKKDRQRIVASIFALAKNPRPPGSEKLAGSEDRYRVRRGDYRVDDRHSRMAVTDSSAGFD